MAKAPTIASLVRLAGKSDVDFVNTTSQVLEETDTERVSEFLTRLNIPLDVGASEEEARDPEGVGMHTPDFENEVSIAAAFEKYFERHLRTCQRRCGH